MSSVDREMPYTLISFLILFWLVGLTAQIGWTLVYLFLAAAIVVFVQVFDFNQRPSIVERSFSSTGLNM
jgi:hypothetical protein